MILISTLLFFWGSFNTSNSSHFFNEAYAQSPEISFLEPISGYNHEDTSITINGNNFTDGATVDLILRPAMVNSIEYQWPNDLSLDGNYLYLLSGMAIKIIDITNIMHPVEVCSYNLLEGPREIYVQGNYAYVVVHSVSILAGYGCCGPVYISGYRLLIVNVTNKKNPEVLGSYDSPVSGAASLSIRSVKGNYAYLSENVRRKGSGFCGYDCVPITTVYQGVRIIDISDKNNPYPIGDYISPSKVDDISVEGDYAYVATTSDGLRIVNITDKTDPYEVSSYNPQSLFASRVISVYVVDNYAYVGTMEGLNIIDISDKAQPQEIASFTDGGSPKNTFSAPKSMKIQGDHAYVVCDSIKMGIGIINISDKENPQSEGFYTATYAFRGIAVQGDSFFVIGDDGVDIVQFARKKCIDISVIDPQTITAIVPKGLTKGFYDVVVINPDKSEGDLPQGFQIKTLKAKKKSSSSSARDNSLSFLYDTAGSLFYKALPTSFPTIGSVGNYMIGGLQGTMAGMNIFNNYNYGGYTGNISTFGSQYNLISGGFPGSIPGMNTYTFSDFNYRQYPGSIPQIGGLGSILPGSFPGSAGYPGLISSTIPAMYPQFNNYPSIPLITYPLYPR
jgi:hypothetical protein